MENKSSTSKGIIISVVILSILIIGLGIYVLLDKPTETSIEESKENKTTKISANESKKLAENEIDTDEQLEQIQQVYENAYKIINKNEGGYRNYNENELSPYFTEKALAYIQKEVNNSNQAEPAFFYSLFGVTNQGVRTLKIETSNNKEILATGTLESGNVGTDSDSYPLYIIFKNDSNTWKIDMFE